MTINFKSFEELFAPEYQLTYISTGGHIDVGPNTYSVFHVYTTAERQGIFQVCKKHLPWESTQEQEQWERTMYMYQFIIKSPPPFPYEEYPLSEDIIMAITYPIDCDTSAKKTEWIYAAQELLRHIHNLFSYWLHNSITQAQYNNPPLPVVPENLRPMVRTAFTYLKSKYPFKVQLTQMDWDKFIDEDFTPRSRKISGQIGIQRALLKNSVKWTINIGEI